MLRRTARVLVLRSFRTVMVGIAFSGAVFISAPPPAVAQAASQEAVQAAVQEASQATSRQVAATRQRPKVTKHGEPGKFEFYVLALSWSPSFCEASRERRRGRRNDPQCAARPYAFVVHGLWPQHETGFPSNCQVPAPRLPRRIVDSMLDLMPSPRLVFHEWDRHGTCTGLTGQGYFDAVRKARAAITVPDEYRAIGKTLSVKPADVAAAFIRVNPGLTPQALQVACDGRRLTGVRICMTKELAFRDCAEVARKSCRADTVIMPPMRGPRAADGSH
jgi:ribonuclease T2